MYYAGLRSSEARLLARENIFIEKRILVVRGKGNKQRIVPIMKDFMPYLIKGNSEGFLWLNPKTKAPWKDIRQCLNGAAKRAGIKSKITPHTLRHCFGTHSTEAGVGLRTLQDVMGHSTSQVTEMYTTLAAQHLTIDMEKFSDYSSHD
jgi:integrase/recombinase XerD